MQNHSAYNIKKPKTQWILLANRGGAKLYSTLATPAPEINLIKEINFPDGRRSTSELTTDKHGTRYSVTAGRGNSTAHGNGHPAGQQKHGLDPHQDAVEHVADVFAHELCDLLRDGRTHGNYDEVVLVADPQFLGRIRTFLDKETSNKVVSSVSGNWLNLPEKEVAEKLKSAVPNAVH